MPLAAPDALALLIQAHANSRLAHAFLVTGPQGSGKRQLALGLCSHLLHCKPEAASSHPDVHVLAPESKSRRIVVEQIRELESALRMHSQKGGHKVALIYDADRMMPQAANAFLKTLEEPPQKTHILLLSEHPEQLLETILSRCVSVQLRSLEKPPRSAAETAVTDLLGRFYATRKPDLQGGLWLAQQFQQLLSETKTQIQSTAAATFKAEEKQYKQTVDPKWLEQLEETHAARTEAAYVNERTRMLELLEAFWADVLLQQHGQPARHLEECQTHSSRLAVALSRDEILRKVEVVAAMRGQLGMSGVNEPLALEYGILNAFGPSHFE